MSFVKRCSLPLALALLPGFTPPATAQTVQLQIPIPVRAGTRLPAGSSVQALFNVGSRGRPAASSPAAAAATGSTRNVYNIASGNVFNPYLGMFGGGFGGGFDGLTGAGPGVGYGSAMQGLASYTIAAGEYQRNIQTARLGQEYVRQANIDSAQRRIEFEMWVDKVRPTSQRMLDTERSVELERARRVPILSEVVSGRMLNTLLKSIQKGKLNRGPNIPLDEDMLRHINLNGGTSGGNVGLLKTIDKVIWPEALREESYQEARKKIVEDFKKAVAQMKNGEMPDRSVRRDLRASYQALSNELDKNVNEVPLSQQTEALRFLRQVNSAITAMSDPQVVNYYNKTWSAKGKNVAELVDHMTQQGLTFAEAAEGDEASYQSLYDAMRSFEAGMQEG